MHASELGKAIDLGVLKFSLNVIYYTEVLPLPRLLVQYILGIFG
jgi:hypothetical protein